VIASLDVDLPRERAREIRTEPAFFRASRLLFDALERGGA
jgi:hypothetical protein